MTPEQVEGFRRMRREVERYGNPSPLLKTRAPMDGLYGLIGPIAVLIPVLICDIALLRSGTHAGSKWSHLVTVIAVNVGGVAAAASMLLIRRAHRRIRRFNAGQCIACGYDLTGLESNRCPECGGPALK